MKKFSNNFQNLVKMGADMKSSSLLLLLLLVVVSQTTAQDFDSSYIGTNSALVTKGNKVLTFSIPNDANDIISTKYFDGNVWKNISQDTMPTINLHHSRCTFSNFSDHLYVADQYHLWEFDGKNWIKHAIYDSLYHRRRFEGIVELPDSSLIITAFTHFISGQSGNVVYINKKFSEVLRFKNGKFTTIKSYGLKNGDIIVDAYQNLLLNKNGTYSLYAFDESENKDKWELVTYNSFGNVVRKDSIPDLQKFGFRNDLITFSDYLFDSKGSLWFLTQSYNEIKEDSNGNPSSFINFVGLVEVKIDGTINLYNDNIGIDKSTYRSRRFTIDDEDNIWFVYSHLKIKPHFYPSLYKLHSDRRSVTEYSNETIFKNSIFYNGGDDSYKLESPSYSLIVYSDKSRSIFAAGGGPPLLQFFPENVTSIKDIELETIHLYPNPVSNGKNITIQNSEIGNSQEILYILRDINGYVVCEEKTFSNENKVKIEIENLISGSYIVSIFKNNKPIIQSVFIKE